MNKNIKVLDNGFVKCIETFGDELTVVNAARVSFGVHKEELDDKDIKLIKYLIKNKHFSPFRHIFVRLHIKAPEFVMRQWYKHVVGIETTSTHCSQLHGWNEISGRYTENMEFYTPISWREQSKDNKQGSAGNVDAYLQTACSQLYDETMDAIMNAYNTLLANNIAKEQARIILPLNIYTEVIWTGSFQAIMNFLELRCDQHSQYEIRIYADAIKDVMESKFPVLCKIWLDSMIKT
jgi:thymidylate synthase (FAD)